MSEAIPDSLREVWEWKRRAADLLNSVPEHLRAQTLEAEARKVAERLGLNLSTRPASQAARSHDGRHDTSAA